MWLVKKIIYFYFIFCLFSSLTYSQAVGVGFHARLFPSVSQTILNNNFYSEYEIDNFLLTGLFISYKTSGTSQWKFTLKYSFGQKDISQPTGLSFYEPKKLLNLYSFELAVCYVIDLSPKFKINVGIMPGYYIAKLNESYNDEKDFYEYKFSLTPIVDLSFEVYDKIDINFLMMYSIEKYEITKEYSYYPIDYQQFVSGFDEYDFSGINLGIAVTYWINI
jgi:hypothetical protein